MSRLRTVVPVAKGAVYRSKSAPPTPALRFVPSLDGIRAIAVTLVVASHIDVPVFRSGAVGVDVFFVVSGYLITALLLQERTTTGRVHFGYFYARRALRLYPALLAMVAAVLLVAVVAGEPPGAPFAPAAGLVASAVAAVAYLTDFLAGFGGPVADPFLHTWSLSVEEHFYLAWPLLLVAALGRGWTVGRLIAALTTATAMMVVASSVFYVRNGAAEYFVTYSPVARPVGLLVGCMLALLMSQPVSPWLDRFGRWAPAALVTLLVIAALDVGHAFWSFGGRVLVSLLSACVVVGAVRGSGGWFSRLLGHPLLVAIGQRSYGYYLWHVPVSIFFTVDRLGLVAAGVAKVGVTLVLVEVSYRFVERPFLKLRHRFRPQGG